MTDSVLDNFRNTIKDLLRQYRRKGNDLEVVSYVGGAKPDSHQIPWINLSEHEFVADQIQSLQDHTLHPQFDPKDEAFVENLQFYVVLMQLSSEDTIYFFRTYTSKKELRRSTFFGSLFSDGQFDQVKEPLFLFDRHIDCISYGDTMLILQQNNFQRIFSFFDMVEKAARENLNRINQAIPIDNFNSFAEACIGHQQKMFKLNNIASKDYLTDITIEDLRSVIEHHGLNVPIIKEDGQEALRFDEADRWEILRLLDDDYLESRMTGYLYESNSKREYESE